jgi:small subunit ribosomal protein S1
MNEVPWSPDEASSSAGDASPALEPTLAAAPVVPDEPVEGAGAGVLDHPSASDDDEISGDGGFAGLLETSAPPSTFVVGARVRGKIISIGEEQTIISFTGRPEAVLPTAELRGPGGTLLLRVDDAISATVDAVGEPVVLKLGKKRALVSAARIRTAMEEKQPVTGLVRTANKGGYEVRIGGVRAFCPLSHIERGHVANPEVHVGQAYSFRVLRWENGGRNIVVSRRGILKEEAAAQAAVTRDKIAVDAEFDGRVTRVQPFGAFVDIGGIEGLLHVSRLGRGHVQDASQLLAPGQMVRVRVTAVENLGSAKERVALASADPNLDPWETIHDKLRPGAIVDGKVMRLAEFGVFVNLLPGIDGLVHVSEIAPDAASGGPKPGDAIQVRVVRVDPDKRRVSLSMRLTVERPPERTTPRPPRGDRRPRPRETSPAPSGGPLTHTMADQLLAARRKLQAP